MYNPTNTTLVQVGNFSARFFQTGRAFCRVGQFASQTWDRVDLALARALAVSVVASLVNQWCVLCLCVCIKRVLLFLVVTIMMLVELTGKVILTPTTLWKFTVLIFFQM